MIKKYHNHKLQTNPWHREEETNNNHETPEDKQRKATSRPLFSIKMIEKLELTQSYAQQNIKQLQNPTIGLKINNESTKTTREPHS